MQERRTNSQADRNTATDLVKHHIALASAKFVMNAQAQSIEGWDNDEIELATTGGAFTAAIADPLVIVDAIRRQFSSKSEK
jgi:hypothetical protein